MVIMMVLRIRRRRMMMMTMILVMVVMMMLLFFACVVIRQVPLVKQARNDRANVGKLVKALVRLTEVPNSFSCSTKREHLPDLYSPFDQLSP